MALTKLKMKKKMNNKKPETRTLPNVQLPNIYLGQLIVIVLLGLTCVLFSISAFQYDSLTWFSWLLGTRIAGAILSLLFLSYIIWSAAEKKIIYRNIDIILIAYCFLAQTTHGILEDQQSIQFYSYTGPFFILAALAYRNTWHNWIRCFLPFFGIILFIPMIFKDASMRSSVGSFIDNFSPIVICAIIGVLVSWINTKRNTTLQLNIELQQLLSAERDHQAQIIEEQTEELSRAKVAQAIAKTTQMIAHDLKTPINVIQSALDSNSWDEFERRRPNLYSAMFRLRGMVDSFKRADIEGLIYTNWGVIPWKTIIQELQPIAEKAGTVIHLNDVYDEPAFIDLPKIERVLMNLIRNSIEAGAKNVWLTTRIAGMDFAIEVQDDGSGVPEDFVSKLFCRGNTLKADGSGLGLCFVKETANGHGGEAKYERKDNRSSFIVTLPGAISEKQDKIDKPMIPTIRQEQRETFLNTSPPENFAKITVSLTDKVLEARVMNAIAGEFPTIEIIGSLENSAFLWTNDHQLIKEAIVKKVPIQIIGANDGHVRITHIIREKLKYYT